MEGRYVYGDDVYVDDYYMDEEWEYIHGFPDYMVSNKGRVWSVKTQQFLTLKQMDDHGHLGVCLFHGDKSYYRYIHRLVAETFIPNPHNHPIVRHINDDPTQNTVDDLLWGTQKDNLLDAARNGTAYSLTDEDREKSYAKSRTPVVATNTKTGEVHIFKGQTEAARLLDLCQSNIWKVLVGKRRHTKGYHFKFLGKENATYGCD